jgi:hypothetical protein
MVTVLLVFKIRLIKIDFLGESVPRELKAKVINDKKMKVFGIYLKVM